MVVEITDVKIVGACSKHSNKEHPVPKDKNGKVYTDDEIECVACDVGSSELKTVKDLEFETMVCDNRDDKEETDLRFMTIVEVEELMTEAIKLARSNVKWNGEYFQYNGHRIDWLKFLGITEEDLK